MKALVVNALGRGFDLEDMESHDREVLDVIKPTNGEVLWRRPRIRQVWDRGVPETMAILERSLSRP